MHTLKRETRKNMSRKPKEVAHPELLRGEWALNCKDDAKYNAKDEYYTQYENVRQVFEEYIDTSVLKGKVIWLPCDTEESWFYKWLEIDYTKIREYPTYTDGLSRYIRFDARWIKRFE